MEGWIVACAALAILALVAWRLWIVRRQLRAARHQLTEARRGLEQAQGEINALRIQQSAVGAAVTDALLVLDAERHITWANPAARELLAVIGLLGELEGKTLIEATRSHELDALAGAPAAETATRQLTLGQQTFSARVVAVQAGCVVALEDVSELQRLGRARRDFVANISHELRTPLASIRLLVDTLQAGALADSTVAPDMLSKINLEVDALSQLARELLDLAMIESGQMPLKLISTDLRELARTQVERFLPQAEQKKIALLVDIAACPHVLADKEMIGRVFANLLHNALKFTPEGGQIVIGAQAGGDAVTVSVSDTGPGIPREELPRVFERFYKVDRARGQAGTGLGLAVARHIVEGHSGRIWAESELGKGTTFRFTLPVG